MGKLGKVGYVLLAIVATCWFIPYSSSHQGLGTRHLPIDVDLIEYISKKSIRLHEGFSSSAYPDGVDRFSYGFGQLATNIHSTIKKRSALNILDITVQQDTAKSLSIVESCSNGSHIANVVMMHQLGRSWRFVHTKSWAFLKDCDLDQFSLEIENSIWFKHTPERVREVQRLLQL